MVALPSSVGAVSSTSATPDGRGIICTQDGNIRESSSTFFEFALAHTNRMS
jgi:hypothetical protein